MPDLLAANHSKADNARPPADLSRLLDAVLERSHLPGPDGTLRRMIACGRQRNIHVTF